MILMLDTDYCIDLIRKKAFRDRSLQWIRMHEAGDLGISVVTLAELEYGAQKSLELGEKRESLGQIPPASGGGRIWQ